MFRRHLLSNPHPFPSFPFTSPLTHLTADGNRLYLYRSTERSAVWPNCWTESPHRSTGIRNSIQQHVRLCGIHKRVYVGMPYRTIHDVNDGFDEWTAACREYTLPRDDPNSEIKLWIACHAKIGPILQVKTTCYLDIKGIESQIPSTSGNGSKSWVVISRGKNRYVEEIRDKDPDYSSENIELANYRSTEETHARQSTTHAWSQYNASEDCIPIKERNSNWYYCRWILQEIPFGN